MLDLIFFVVVYVIITVTNNCINRFNFSCLLINMSDIFITVINVK